jgi:hypothetical protein
MAGTSPAKTSYSANFPLLFGRKIFPGQPCGARGKAREPGTYEHRRMIFGRRLVFIVSEPGL